MSAPLLFRQALQASLDKEFDKALDLFKKLTSFERYKYKAYAFSTCENRLKECDVDFLKAMAEKGHALAQNNLGYCYDCGHGVAQDCNEAVRWYRLAANQGLAVAQFNLGDCYEKGEGVVQDYNEAVRLYRLAANQGNALAQNNLGRCYEKGQGVVQDYNEAVRLYRLAVNQGHAFAQNNIARCQEFL